MDTRTKADLLDKAAGLLADVLKTVEEAAQINTTKYDLQMLDYLTKTMHGDSLKAYPGVRANAFAEKLKAETEEEKACESQKNSAE